MKHIHTYKKSKWDRNIYACAAPDCSSYSHKLKLNGKLSLCNNCGEQFVLTTYALTLSKPKCDLCSNTRKGIALRAAQQNDELKKIFAEEQGTSLESSPEASLESEMSFGEPEPQERAEEGETPANLIREHDKEGEEDFL